MKLRNSIGDLFIMSRTERNGALVLILLLLIVLLLRFLLPSIFKNDKNYLTEIEEQIEQIKLEKDSLEQLDIRKTSELGNYNNDPITLPGKGGFPRRTPVKVEYFVFDPNTIEYDGLLGLGFPERVAHTYINYRSKIGGFNAPEEIGKVYGVDSSLYSKIKPYIKLKKLAKQTATFDDSAVKERKRLKLEINTADSAAWTTLRGIGPVFAKRICYFRSYLGGFVRIEQIKEVYHLPEETFFSIKDYLSIDTSEVIRMNINFAEVDDLKKHPYCSYRDAKNIVDYRTKKGPIDSLGQLLTDSVLVDSVFFKIVPYLTIRDN